MRRIIVLAVVACISAALSSTTSVGAATPAAGATPGAVAAPTATPEPATSMTVSAGIWKDARPSFAPVVAYVGDTECAREDVQVVPPGSYVPFAHLTIPPANERTGCGTPGATVRFTIDGRQANETVAWTPGGDGGLMMLTVGAPFARYSGDYRPPPGSVGEVVPMIGATVCGVSLGAALGEGPTYSFDVVVDSAARTPGCGTPGAVVRFRLDSDGTTAATGASASQTAVWEPGGRGTLNLTFSSASSLPASGDGGAADGGGPWAAVVALALLGAIAVLAGVVYPRSRVRITHRTR